MRNLYVIVCFCCCINLNAQNTKIKILQPFRVDLEIDFDTMGKIADRASYLENKGRENLTPSEDEELEGYYEKYGDETALYVWDIIWGCSWYCGGGPREVTASSSLKSVPVKKGTSDSKELKEYYLENQPEKYIPDSITYDAGNAHDLYLKTAWVEGVKGYGIGEYLTYTFDNHSARITTISIYNGYVKSKKTWKDNSRVRSLKMYVNGKPYAVLQLKDTPACQNFDLGEPLGRRPDGKDLVLKFEITDVYPGDKYDDTAITELFFDGIDVHCVGKGTRILMNDHSLKNIEAIKAGDVVKSFDITRNNYVASTVKKVHKATHGELLKLKLENNAEIMVTEEHPFLTKNKSWCSHAPQKSLYNQWIVNEYEAGDLFAFYTGAESLNYVKLIEIEKINSPGTETYTLELESGDNFIGNGFIIREE